MTPTGPWSLPAAAAQEFVGTSRRAAARREPPPNVIRVWDRHGDRWGRRGVDSYAGDIWCRETGEPAGQPLPWPDLVRAYGPISQSAPENAR